MSALTIPTFLTADEIDRSVRNVHELGAERQAEYKAELKALEKRAKETTIQPPQYRPYRRSQIAELADWQPGFDMTGVSVSAADAANGSPQAGDKIARNPANHAERWLVRAAYFAANFEPMEDQA